MLETIVIIDSYHTMIVENFTETEEINEFKVIRCIYFGRWLNLQRNGKTVFLGKWRIQPDTDNV